MSNYTKTTDFASKDTLNSGDPNKIVRGTEFDTEFNNIATASATKADLNNPSFEGNVSVNGDITVPSNATIDGRDVSADGTKLDTIETSADVTDTTNVTAAGAVMDSELTDEAAVKALDQGVATTDSPTFAGATLGAVTYAATDGTDGQVLTTDGAGNATFEALPDSLYLNVTDFGATGDGSDQTTALQNAINHASTRGIQTIFFPKGHYKYTTLRFYHDQTNNTAFQGTNLFIGNSTNGTNGTAAFAFGWYIADASDLTVTVEGVEQTLNTHYTVSGVGSDTGGTVTFTAGNVPLVPADSTVTNRKGDGETLEFFYNGTVIPDASNVSVTVDGVASTQFTVDIGKRLVVFNAGHEPPAPADPNDNNVVITIQKTVNIASNNRDGRVQLRGTGRLAIADLVGLDKNRTRLYGSVLESTGDGIIIDTDQEFSTPTDARNFVAKDLTFLADNTGQIIRTEKNPGMSFDTCSFKQFNPAGTGLEVRNCWFFTLNQCYVVGQRYIDTFTGDGTQQTFTYTFDNPSATSDILVQLNGGALTETTDYTVTMGATKTVTLTSAGATKVSDAIALSGAKTIDVQRINTGDGISSQFVGRSFGNFAGLWTITQSLVDSFANGVHWTGGSVTNFSVRDSAIQNCGNYNIYADSGVIHQMLLDNVYMENQKTQGVSFIKGNGSGASSASIRNLKMTNCFFLGGGTNPRVTGPCINLDSVDVIDIEGMYHYRVRQPFLNVTDTKNNQNVPGEIKNSIFATDSGQTKFLDLEPTVYLLSGILPNVHNCVWPNFEDGFYNTTNNVLLFNSTVESNFLRQYTDIKGTTGTAKFGFGDTKVINVPEGSDTFTPATPEDEFTYTFDSPDSQNRIIVERKLSGETGFTETFDFTVNLSTKLVTLGSVTASGEEVKISTGNPYNITGSDSRTYYDLTHSMAGGLAVFLPDTGEFNDGRLIIVKNNEATSSGYPYILVRNNSDQSTVIAQLSPGQAGLFIMDKQDGNKFKYTGRTFTNDLEMADNHKISFGRSDDLQIFHQSSDNTNRLVSGAANFALPTADGTSGQVITTDGSGGLSFTNVSGVGINAVVDDTTPQLGGDLDLNGSDITGTGNLDFTGTINTVLSVDGTTEDVFITGAVPGLELVESDNGGSRVRYAVENSEIFQSLYGADTSTFGSITQQTRLSDGTSNQVIYTYDAGTNDYHWWGTRAGGDRLVQIDSSGKFRVRGGDVSFFNDGVTSEAFFWDASTSRLGLGTTSPYRTLTVSGDQVVEGLLEVTAATPQILFSVPSGGLDSRIHNDGSGNFIFGTGTNSATPTERMRITSAGSVDVTGNLTVDAGSNGKIEFGNITTNYGRLYADSTGTFVGSVTADPLIFRTTNAERMRIDSSGNVKIGTNTDRFSYLTATTANLQIDGGVLFEPGSGNNVEIFNYRSTDMLFGNGGAEAMRIDSSGNLLVGATSSATTSYGAKVLKDNSASEIFAVHRQASDGSLIEFARGGTAVGNIQSRAGVVTTIVLNPASGNGAGLSGGTKAIVPADEAGIVDNDISLGVSSHRFKDLYLSNTLTLSNATTSSFLQVSSNILQFGTSSADPVVFYVNSSEKARLDSSGNLLVGTTNLNPHQSNTAADAGTVINPNGIVKMGRNENPSLLVNRIGNDGLLAQWLSRGSFVGNISVTATTATYNSASDVRLKDNIVDAPSASDDIDAIQVRSFDWKVDGSHQKYGMVAQELQTVAPDAVSEGDTEEDMMGVDYSKLVPMLVKEIQSLRARVAQLEND